MAPFKDLSLPARSTPSRAGGQGAWIMAAEIAGDYSIADRAGSAFKLLLRRAAGAVHSLNATPSLLLLCIHCRPLHCLQPRCATWWVYQSA